MYKTLLTVCFLLLNASMYAQFPVENSTLNYRLIGFKAPLKENVTSYILEIADGLVNNREYFEKNTIIRDTSADGTFIQTVPRFASTYTWRITYCDSKDRCKERSPLYHFNTGYSVFVDSTKYRLNVITPDTVHKDLYVCVDATRAIYEVATGKPVWYMPDVPGIVTEQTVVRDLECTQQKTLTFLAGDKICEIDYEGNILWAGPDDGKVSGDSSEFYHHEFTRLANGHYMAAGSEYVPFDNSRNYTDTGRGMKKTFSDKAVCGTLIEYDSAGNIVWHWKSSVYFGYKTQKLAEHGYYLTAKTHLNGFFFDEEKNFIYLSFRDLSRILKVRYPEGNVVAVYGEQKIPIATRNDSIPFYSQHACRIGADGNLYLFNNNLLLLNKKKRGREEPSTLLVLKEDTIAGSVSKVWEFSCDIDSHAPDNAGGGGSMIELEDHSYLVSMGTINRLFIVNRAKQILWNALIEKKEMSTWARFGSYRVNSIEGGDKLRRLLFNTKF